MRFRHQFTVHAPRARVVQFHAQAASMAAITPPPVRVRFRSAPALLSEGTGICFTLGIGPISIPWRASIDLATPEAFVDRQVAGPFRRWVHRHSFKEVSPNLTQVEDRVEAVLPLHPIWTPVALGMWLSLPLLFAYRAWKTCRILEEERS